MMITITIICTDLANISGQDMPGLSANKQSNEIGMKSSLDWGPKETNLLMIQLAIHPTVNRTTTSCSLSSQDLGIEYLMSLTAAKVDKSIPSESMANFCDSRNSYDELPHQYESSKENKHQVRFENVQIIKHIQYVFVIIISYVNNTMIHDAFRPFIQHSSLPQNHLTHTLWTELTSGWLKSPEERKVLVHGSCGRCWKSLSPSPLPVPTPSAG